MGDYFVTLTIPAGTPEDKPAEKEITVEGEILAEIAYLIPGGWHGVPTWALYYGIRQIYPEPGSAWITGNDVYRQMRLNWPLPESPCKLTLKGVSPNARFDHDVYVWLELKPVEEARPWKAVADFVKSFKRLLGMR